MMKRKISILDRFLTTVERVGNALPAPAFLFAILALIVLLVSALGATLGWSGVSPSSGEVVEVKNMLGREGIHNILLSLASNFTGFAPLGIVFVAMLGVGIAEGSGLIRAAIVALLSRIGGSSVTFMVVMTGIISNVASDIGYILVIPIGGVIFHSLGRNPLAGMAAAFAGVSGGFSANILISSTDVLLSGITTTAAEIVDPGYVVGTLSNYFFMCVSTVVIATIGTIVTNKVVEPRLGTYNGDVAIEPLKPLSKLEKRGLILSFQLIVVWVAVLAIGVIPQNGILRDIETNSVLRSVVLRGFVSLLFFIAATSGIVYGFVTKKFNSAKDILSTMNGSIGGMTSYFVLVFFAAQFISWFNDSNLGMVLAIKGVHIIESLNVGLIPLVVMTIIFTAFTNLVIGSESAKWLLLAPIVVPMFMMLGYSPELAQCAYRIGDSSTNIITPMMSYFPLIIIYFQKYRPESGLGTIISSMLPYSMAFLVAWTIFVIVWLLLGIPLGPGAPLLLSSL
ncbi:MAG: AbgT family transporter [Rikenellaceae bacterium]